MNNIFPKLTLLILVSIFITSCWTAKKTTNQQVTPNLTEGIIDSVKHQYLKYNTLSIKFNSRFESDEKNLSFSGQIRLKRDSIIWISVTPVLGIEAMRIKFTRDSVMLLNRLENSYLAEKYDLITKYTQTEINFNFLQSFFLNELIPYQYNEDVSIINNYLVSSDSSHFILANNNSNINDSLNKNIVHIISILKNINKVENIATYDNASSRNIKINYSEFEPKDSTKFPTNINLVLKNKSDFINLSIKYTKITNDNELNFPFNIPQKFERIKY
ncbi:MAG: hypothetical protein A2046_05895 [Bacteroidetes bacterium GWA2_30_7]|nr:MAG: hypothetical protein A2046_05895 [Bacteroidetes bacterium GWA2_30_7]